MVWHSYILFILKFVHCKFTDFLNDIIFEDHIFKIIFRLFVFLCFFNVSKKEFKRLQKNFIFKYLKIWNF